MILASGSSDGGGGIVGITMWQRSGFWRWSGAVTITLRILLGAKLSILQYLAGIEYRK
jgi:hypothetical protein